MSSDGIGLAGTSPTISLIGERESGESTQTSRIDRAVDHGVDCAWAAVAGLMAAIAQMQQEIDELWRDAVTREKTPSSERLVEASHALRRALRELEHGHRIG